MGARGACVVARVRRAMNLVPWCRYQIPGRIPLRVPGHTGAWPVPGNGRWACVCVRACVCVCARACVCVCVCAMPRAAVAVVGAVASARHPAVVSFGWRGWVPFDELLHTYNPPQGFVATANNRATPLGYKQVGPPAPALGSRQIAMCCVAAAGATQVITCDWDEGSDGYRAERITSLINTSRKLGVPDMIATQTDQVSFFARDMVPFILALPVRGQCARVLGAALAHATSRRTRCCRLGCALRAQRPMLGPGC